MTRSGGRPVPVPGVRQLDKRRILREVGLRDQIHPCDAFVFGYPSRAVFDESAARDRALGNDVHGPYETRHGLVGVIDVRPQLRANNLPVTDPALPDDYLPPARMEKRCRD